MSHGFSTRSITRPDDATLWVSPDGNDANGGAYHSPLESIQTAIDRLDDQFGPDRYKYVGLQTGIYTENVLINSPNIQLSGEHLHVDFTSEDRGPCVELQPEDDSRPAIAITNTTKKGFDDYMSDGGPNFSWTAPDSYSYTGADIAGREIRQDIQVNGSSGNRRALLHVTLQGVLIRSNNTTTGSGIFIAGFPQSGEDQMQLRNVFLHGVYPANINDSNALFAKNVRYLAIANCTFFGEPTVFDTCKTYFANYGTYTRYGSSNVLNGVVFAGDDQSSTNEGGIGGTPTISQWQRPRQVGGLYLLGKNRPVTTTDSPNIEFDAGRDNQFVWASSEDFGHSRATQSINCQKYFCTSNGTGSLYLNRVMCETFDHQGSGTIDCQLMQCTGNVVISNGSGHKIRGGTVQGDVTISGGTDVELRGVTIEGKLDVDGSNTTVHLKGCHIQGDVEIEDQSGTSVTMDGGSYMGSLTDPGNNLTRNTGS